MTDSIEPTFRERIAACAAAMNAAGETIRRGLEGFIASGGGIQPSKRDDDSVYFQLSPGYVSWDDGKTWQEEQS